VRSLVIAFVLGTLAVGLTAYGVATVVLIVAVADGWGSFDVALGPLVLVALERDASGEVTTMGAGLAAVALVGGVLNLVGALALRRRA
jgi:hypothetical protein